MQDALTTEEIALLEYRRLFIELDDANAHAAKHPMLPGLRHQIATLRLANGWQADMETHLRLLERSAAIAKAAASK